MKGRQGRIGGKKERMDEEKGENIGMQKRKNTPGSTGETGKGEREKIREEGRKGQSHLMTSSGCFGRAVRLLFTRRSCRFANHLIRSNSIYSRIYVFTCTEANKQIVWLKFAYRNAI